MPTTIFGIEIHAPRYGEYGGDENLLRDSQEAWPRIAISMFFLFFITFVVSVKLVSAGKGPYPEHAIQMANDAIAILVKRNECASVNDCNVKDRLGCLGDSGHIYIYVFEAESLKSETVHDLIALGIQKHDEYQQRYEVQMLFYKETLQKRNHDNFLFWGPVQPFMELKLRKGDGQ